eukprot:2142855-Pyramimonas_sp.AAC.1
MGPSWSVGKPEKEKRLKPFENLSKISAADPGGPLGALFGRPEGLLSRLEDLLGPFGVILAVLE